MRFQYLACLLLAGFAFGQTEQAATPSASEVKPEKAASSASRQALELSVRPDDPVITLNNFCAEPARQGEASRRS